LEAIAPCKTVQKGQKNGKKRVGATFLAVMGRELPQSHKMRFDKNGKMM
jgi:hypothetical protein